MTRTYLKHNSVNLFFYFLVRNDDSALWALQQQVEESETLLLANVIINVQIVFKTRRLPEG